jgi:hypothetical protein
MKLDDHGNSDRPPRTVRRANNAYRFLTERSWIAKETASRPSFTGRTSQPPILEARRSARPHFRATGPRVVVRLAGALTLRQAGVRQPIPAPQAPPSSFGAPGSGHDAEGNQDGPVRAPQLPLSARRTRDKSNRIPVSRTEPNPIAPMPPPLSGTTHRTKVSSRPLSWHNYPRGRVRRLVSPG